MNESEKPVPDCFALFTHEELQNVNDLCNFNFMGIKNFSIEKIHKKCMHLQKKVSYYKEFVPVSTKINDELIFILFDTGRYITNENDKHSRIELPLTKEDISALTILKQCIYETQKLTHTYLTNEGKLLNKRPPDKSIIFSSYPQNGDSLFTEFEIRFILDAFTYAHYSFNALKLRNTYFRLRQMSILNKYYEDLMDFDSSIIYQFSLLKNSKYNLNDSYFYNTIMNCKEHPIIETLEKLLYYNEDGKKSPATKSDFKKNIEQIENDFQFSSSLIDINVLKDLSTGNYKRNMNKKALKLIPHRLEHQGEDEIQEYIDLNSFLIKYSLDLLKYPTLKGFYANTYKFTYNDNTLPTKKELETQLKNLSIVYDKLKITFKNLLREDNVFDYYFKKEYSLGLLNLHHIMKISAEQKKIIECDTLIKIQQLPIVFSRQIVTNFILDNPNLTDSYIQFFIVLHQLFFLTIYEIYERDYHECTKYMCTELYWFKQIYMDCIEYEDTKNPPQNYGSNLIDCMLSVVAEITLTLEKGFINTKHNGNNSKKRQSTKEYDTIKSYWGNLYKQCPRLTKKNVIQYITTSIPNISIPKIKNICPTISGDIGE